MEFIDRNKDNFAIIRRKNKQNSRIAFFIHGYGGNYLKTWGSVPNILKEVDDARIPILEGWDYLFIGYDSGNITSYIDIAHKLNFFLDSVNRGNSPFDIQYSRVSLIGHSMGTLGIRQLLCDRKLHLNSLHKILHSIVLFGSPINGSFWAHFPFYSTAAKTLVPNNPMIVMLNHWTASINEFIKWPAPKVVVGTKDKVIPKNDADLIDFAGDYAPIIRVDSNHGKMIKPKNINSIFFDILKDALK